MPDTSWFTEGRFGLFVHWGLYSVPARGEWAMQRERIAPQTYERYAPYFTPDRFCPEEWAERAWAAGMRYAVITAKHHEGYCLWDSAYTDYTAAKTGPGRDLLRPTLEAFRNRGLRVGVYYSLVDWHHPDFAVDGFHPLRGEAELPAPLSKQGDMPAYREYMRLQLTELLTNYGDIDLIWFDFSYADDVVWGGKGRDDWGSAELIELVRRLRPDILINDRLDLPDSADILTPERHIPFDAATTSSELPREISQSMCETWGYNVNAAQWRSSESLVRTLAEAVSVDANLLLNVGPTARGELEPRARQRLSEVAAWMDRHAASIHGAGPCVVTAPSGCVYTCTSTAVYVHLLSWPDTFLYLPGLGGRVTFARMLADHSEVIIRGPDPANLPAALRLGPRPADLLTLELPAVPPDGPLPVIELMTSEDLRRPAAAFSKNTKEQVNDD